MPHCGSCEILPWPGGSRCGNRGGLPEDALDRAFINAQIAEALTNLSIADEPLDRRADAAPNKCSSREAENFILDDELFWGQRIAPADQAATDEIPLYVACISEWVARVPGLYWLPGAKNLRKVDDPAKIERRTDHWVTFTPQGKSSKVSGGVGTVRFPPSQDGYRLVTLTTSLNASAGVPTLISPDVWACHKLGEGAVIHNGKAVLTEMPLQWAAQFPVVREVPRICLKIDDPANLYDVKDVAPILIHPFSVLEYWDGPAMFHDFVYITADSSERDHRRQITQFFEQYRTDRGREGVYLTPADIDKPMWDSKFTDPADMRLRQPHVLEVIKARLRKGADDENIVDALIRRLSRLSGGETTLRRLSSKAGIEPNRWSEGGRLVDEATRLVHAAVELGKQQALLYAVQLELAA